MKSKLAQQNAATDDDDAPKVASVRILKNEVDEALKALDGTRRRLFISGLSAGLDIGFSLLFIAIVRTLAVSNGSSVTLRLLTATMYSFGFVIVVIGRSELFTEQTSLATLPLLTRESSILRVARLWSIVYAANLLGAAGFAAIAVVVGPATEQVANHVFGDIAREVVDHPWWVMLVSGVLAGWLMGLLSWLVAAGRDTISQIVIIWLITTGIGMAHLHHAILGSVEVMAGIFSGAEVTWGEFGYFLLWTTLGNAIGGPFFILFKFGLAQPDETEGTSE